MRVFWRIMINAFKTYGVYRLNFILWRLRVAVNLLVIYFIWHSIVAGSDSVFNYTASMIFTYVLLANVVASFVFSTQTQDVPADIRSGNLANFLLRPFSYFSYLAARDSADKCLNIIYSIIEITLLYVLLKPPVVIQTNIGILILFIISIIAAVMLYFLLNIIIGSIGFWSSEIWAPRFLVMIFVQFLSGWFFPLDIFPQWLSSFLMTTPFPYLLFFPMKLYLGQLSSIQIMTGFSTMIVWLSSLFIIGLLVWRRGLRIYEAYGR